MLSLKLLNPRTVEDILLAVRIEDNKEKAQAAVKAFKAKKYAQSRILTQADIDTRKKEDLPEREITARLKALGV